MRLCPHCWRKWGARLLPPRNKRGMQTPEPGDFKDTLSRTSLSHDPPPSLHSLPVGASLRPKPPERGDGLLTRHTRTTLLPSLDHFRWQQAVGARYLAGALRRVHVADPSAAGRLCWDGRRAHRVLPGVALLWPTGLDLVARSTSCLLWGREDCRGPPRVSSVAVLHTPRRLSQSWLSKARSSHSAFLLPPGPALPQDSGLCPGF